MYKNTRQTEIIRETLECIKYLSYLPNITSKKGVSLTNFNNFHDGRSMKSETKDLSKVHPGIHERCRKLRENDFHDFLLILQLTASRSRQLSSDLP